MLPLTLTPALSRVVAAIADRGQHRAVAAVVDRGRLRALAAVSDRGYNGGA